MGTPSVVEPQDAEEPPARGEGDDERGLEREARLEVRGQTGLARGRLHECREPHPDEPLGQPRDLRLLDSESVERRPLGSGHERRDRPELPRGRVVAQDRAAVHADESRGHPDDRREELVLVRESADHFRDAEERGEDLRLANFLRIRHIVRMREVAIRTFAARYQPSARLRSPLWRAALCPTA